MSKLDDLVGRAEKENSWRKRCRTCDCDEDILEAIETIIVLISEGKSQASMSWLHRQLVSEFDYPLGFEAMRKHIIRCLPKELYERCWGAK